MRKKNYLQSALLQTNAKRYLYLILFIAPLLNFLSGITIDLYAPSLPSISAHFHTSVAITKNTITITMLGLGIGALINGILIDMIGRRKVLLAGLVIFIISSLLAPFCQSMTELMLIRFIQGFAVSTVAIGSKTLVVDHFSGKQYMAAMLYTSVAYSLGPIVGPFIGGILQFHFGWKSCFYAYAIFAIILFTAFTLFVNESLKTEHITPLKQTLSTGLMIASNRHFLVGSGFLCLGLVEQMIYPILGPFLVEHNLKLTPIIYGNSALTIGIAYLAGTLTNRFLLKRLALKHLFTLGLSIGLLGVLLQLLFAFTIGLSLWSIILPIFVINFGLGFIIANTFGVLLQLFPKKVGTASAIQTFLALIVGVIVLFIISHIQVESLFTVALIFTCLVILQIMLYRFSFAKIFASHAK